MSNYTKITLVLDRSETLALNHSATAELRRPRDQARYLIRQALGLVESQNSCGHGRQNEEQGAERSANP